MNKKTYNSSIDIFKYFCAIMIVDSHIRLINLDKSFLFEFFRFALYFFHMSFGYYYMKGLMKNGSSVALKNVKRLIVPLVFWAILYLPLNIYNLVLPGVMNMAEFVKLQIVSLFINGISFHLWFMAALIVYVIIAGILYKNGKHRILYILIIPLYIVGLLGSYYYEIGNMIPGLNVFINYKYFTTYCRLFLHGLPIFSLGMYYSENEEKLSKVKNSTLLGLIVLFLVISVAELQIMLKTDIKTNICSLGLFLLNIPVFIYFSKVFNPKFDGLGKSMKYISTFMYYSHPLVRTVMASVFMRIFNISVEPLLMTIIAVIICSVTGYIFYRLNNKYINKVFS